MKFEKALIDIEYLKGLDVVLMTSNGDINLNNDLITKFDDDDFDM